MLICVYVFVYFCILVSFCVFLSGHHPLLIFDAGDVIAMTAWIDSLAPGTVVLIACKDSAGGGKARAERDAIQAMYDKATA